ncbi:MAG: hypothetical protein AB7H96_05590 [Vicinamibacterales bacterium]
MSARPPRPRVTMECGELRWHERAGVGSWCSVLIGLGVAAVAVVSLFRR